MRLRFLTTYNFTPIADRRQTTKYRKNMEATVRRVDGEIAVAKGAAVEIDVPERGAAPEVSVPAAIRRRRATRAVPPPTEAAARSAELKGNS